MPGRPRPRPKVRLQGTDAVLLAAQIVLLQTLHYLTLALLLPLLLSFLTDARYLEYLGGSATVGMILDWRELAGRPTSTTPGWPSSPPPHPASPSSGLAAFLPVPGVGSALDGLEGLGAAVGGPGSAAGGPGVGAPGELEGWVRLPDARRSWVLGAGWVLGSCFDITYLYYLIRRPTHILDFTLTLLFVHLLLTTSYARGVPLSLWFWLVMGLCASAVSSPSFSHFGPRRRWPGSARCTVPSLLFPHPSRISHPSSHIASHQLTPPPPQAQQQWSSSPSSSVCGASCAKGSAASASPSKRRTRSRSGSSWAGWAWGWGCR
ncbi:hypothetical protein CALCODRAFT_302704 [Calocera cornea HHB12733]|uniref:Uncharacterized protein n=1 Tax=Calocera cornea HHB12733 TaxID=1353952 RepID=A0A165FJ57_9BASI|nr:hypothetical protein CALCODRAFT_302704 [Calocera cornea HHB12733]